MLNAVLRSARKLRDGAIHRLNARSVSECGDGTMLACRIERRRPGARIAIGPDCYLKGHLITNLDDSQLTIGENTFMNARTVIDCWERISIGSDVLFAMDVLVSDGRHHSLHWIERKGDLQLWRSGAGSNPATRDTRPVVIEDGVWIGAKAIVLSGVILGEGSTVAAGSVVTKSVPPYSLVAGNPAVVVRTLDPADTDPAKSAYRARP